MKLFDKTIPILPSDSIQEDYIKLFNEFGDLDKTYVFNAACFERRQYIENAYEKCKDYLDDDFAIQIKQPGMFISRLWELQLCSVFLFYEFKVVESPKNKAKVSRPDFCLLDSKGNKIWVEAICPDLGNVPQKEEMVPGILYSRNGNIQDDLELVSPRITGAIQKKYQKRNSYVKSEDFNEGDMYVIAINTHHINHRETADMPKELVLYGMGLQWIKQNGQAGRYFHWTIPKKKKDGTSVEIDVALFFRPEFNDLSAVIGCNNWFKFGEDFENEMSKDFVTYFNHNAKNEVGFDEITFGRKKVMKCEGEYCKLIEI